MGILLSLKCSVTEYWFVWMVRFFASEYKVGTTCDNLANNLITGKRDITEDVQSKMIIGLEKRHVASKLGSRNKEALPADFPRDLNNITF